MDLLKRMELSLGTKDGLFKILSQIAVVVTFIAREIQLFLVVIILEPKPCSEEIQKLIRLI